MSATPGALEPSHFKQIATEVSGWLWGTVQGAWNEKQTVSQIIVDAVIGMIPLVGDATAVRDLLAVGTGLAESPEKRESKWQWVLLVVLLLALIPVLGGVLKGVGRLVIRAAEDVMKEAPRLVELSKDIVALLNRLGHKDAVQWLRALDFGKYEAQLVERCKAFCDTVILAINRYALKFQKILPQSFVSRMESMSRGFAAIKGAADKMIPQAVKDLNEYLLKIQAHLVAGGVPPLNRAIVHEAQTGRKVVTYAEEARLIESGSKKAIIHAGKFPQNLADKASVSKVYTYENGFPNLIGRSSTADVADAEGKVTSVEYYSAIAAATGKIKNVDLGDEGAVLFRAFGEKGSTHGVAVDASNPAGFWWGLGEAPTTAEKWRQEYAVLDEFNRNGMVAIMHIPAPSKLSRVKVPACTSTVSEQYGRKIAGQYLGGGGKQAAIDFSLATDLSEVSEMMQKLAKMGGGKATLSNGIVVEVRQSGWKNINGKIGYGTEVIPGAGVTERLGMTELQSKVGETGVHQGTHHMARSAEAGAAKSQTSQSNGRN
jgi:hypothetical protein